MKQRKIWMGLLILILLIPVIYLYVSASQFGFYGKWKDVPAVELTHMNAETMGIKGSVTLPHTFPSGKPVQEVVLTARLENTSGDRIYFKSVCSPVRVYINDELIYDHGAPGTYPAYLQDPPVMVTMVDLPDGPVLNLKMVYNYPNARDSLLIEPPLLGSYVSIFNALVFQQQNVLFAYVFYLQLGLFLIFVGLFVCSFEKQGISATWLGLIALCCGLWGLGECDLVGIFVQNENILFALGFSGIFYMPVAILFYFRSVVGYHNPWPMTLCGFACFGAAVVSTLLQVVFGIPFYNILPGFGAVSSLIFLFAVGYTVYEWRVYGNELAKQLLIPWVIVIVAAALEGIHLLLGKTETYTVFAQVGMMAFLVANCIIGGNSIRKTLALRAENRRMEQEHKMMEVQRLEQRRYHSLLMETRNDLRQQRHDLRHQMAVVYAMAKEGNLEQIKTHLDKLLDQIPGELPVYCENVAVNGVVAYYIQKAQDLGVEVTVELVVPVQTPRVSDNELCVIFGNILENGVEACGNMAGRPRTISLVAYVRNGMLVITQKNTFEGPVHQIRGKFYSSKRKEFGVGLSSVRSVACKHGGNASFSVEEQMFHSSIYIRIQD